jgi:hypothetical protein
MSAVHWIHHRAANWGPAVRGRLAAAVLFGVSLVSATGSAATLEVGPGKPFARIEDANARAQAGDMILVYPRADGQPYQQTAVFVRQALLTFRGVAAEGERWVKIDGSGFDYSGRGSTPRAIFQFNADTDHCVLEGFELTGAHNGSHNGAGVRINQANHVTVRNCSIHGNDMGIMSNGDGSLERGVNQLIEFCRIHHNGAPADPGYNHNLYLGGTSVTMRACEVHSSLTGHNYKSRAHFNRVEYCYLYHSANREFDLVDAGDTARPGSHTVLLGNIIVKDPECRGNRSVIHFGQDGGRDHDGTLHLRFNTVITPFMAPVVELSAPGAKAELIGNIVWDAGRRQNGQRLIAVRAGARLENASGGYNRLAGLFEALNGTSLDAASNPIQRFDASPLADPAQHDFRVLPAAAGQLAAPTAALQAPLPATPGAVQTKAEPPLAWQYRHPADKQKREAVAGMVLGAGGRAE